MTAALGMSSYCFARDQLGRRERVRSMVNRGDSFLSSNGRKRDTVAVTVSAQRLCVFVVVVVVSVVVIPDIVGQSAVENLVRMVITAAVRILGWKFDSILTESERHIMCLSQKGTLNQKCPL